MKTFEAHYRNRLDGTLTDVFMPLTASSLKEAKAIAKQHEGNEVTKWLIGVNLAPLI